MDEFEVQGTAVAALTIVQRLMLKLIDKGILSQADLDALADECVAFHEATGDEPFIRGSEQTALLLRQLFQR